MDKARNMRGGASGFSNTTNNNQKNSEQHKGVIVFSADIGGDNEFSEKSKIGKVRSLSAVDRALSSYKMSCHDVFEKQAHESSSTIIATTERFKLPKKLLNECNGVHHASVPRKLRSAMKKRGPEKSMLLDSEKVKHKKNVTESPKKNSVKKSRDLEENASASFEGIAHDPSPCPEISPREASKISSLHETIGEEQHNLSEREKLLMASYSTATTPTINLKALPMMVKSESSNKVQSHDSELCLAIGLNTPTQSRFSHSERKPDLRFDLARDVDCKQELHMMKDQKENGLALWPGLSPVASASQAYKQSSATKIPDWMQAAICASKQDLMDSCSSGGKISEVVIHQRSRKRCATHVHISHTIRSLKVPKRQVIKEPELHECHQMRAHEASNGGVPIEAHKLNGIRNGVSSALGTGHFSTVRNPHNSKNGIILRQQQCHGDISQAAPTPEVCGHQKQIFNILSLSTGSNGLKVDNSYYNYKIGSRSGPLSKLQDPYFHSLAQQHVLMPIPTPQSQYASTSYLDQPSVAGPQVRLHQPNYYGSPSCGTPSSSTTILDKQQHQSFWAVQLEAQSRSALNCNIMRTQYPNWQSDRRHESSAVSACAQAILPSSPASLEVLGSKITSISGQQQQKLIAPIQDMWTRSSSSFCM
ncbi:hypothetical protein RIF29_06222 [Crotalaria pallida]|uniref:Uncharacterized protein n=1 Tax=Crotalaria pallida TaxID=3830 RepID=A0AAN9PA76_CROPI